MSSFNPPPPPYTSQIPVARVVNVGDVHAQATPGIEDATNPSTKIIAGGEKTSCNRLLIATFRSLRCSPHPASPPHPLFLASRHALAAAVGATAGLLISGPVVALAGAIGAGVATMTSGTTGGVARSAGTMGAAGYDKAVDLDKKHHIVDKTKKAGSSAYSSAKQFDEKHNVSGKTKAAASTAAKRASEFNAKVRVGFINVARIAHIAQN